MAEWPDFDSLPEVPGMPHGCAWGIFDKDGKKDRLGCLNKLTPSIAAAAASEVRDGTSVSLNWALDGFKVIGQTRKLLVHKHFTLGEEHVMKAFDDELEFNTQASSQWDSLIHFPHQSTGCSYNGVKPTVEALTESAKPETNDDTEDWPTLTTWHRRGGLVGRGVLLDYRAYAEAKGIPFSAFKSYGITVEDLEAVAAYQRTELKVGDILLVRTGFTEEIEAPTVEEQLVKIGSGEIAGVRGNMDTVRWVWNRHFAAVAADNPAFEQFPPIKEDGSMDDLRNLGMNLLRQVI